MTQNREKPSTTATDRTTRRGLGTPEARGDERSASGAFPRSWPELPGVEDTPDDASQVDALRNPPADAAEQTRGAFDTRASSRGPEYHPPSVPGGGRERGARGGSGTFRLTAPASVQVRTVADNQDDPQPSTLPRREGVERGTARGGLTLDSRRLLLWAALGLGLGSLVALAVVRVPVRALGVLRATRVPESLVAQVSGSVVQVQASPGDEVEPGSALLSLHAPELQQRLDSRRAELALVRQELEAAAEEERRTAARSTLALERRRKLLAQRLELKETELAQRTALSVELAARGSADGMMAGELSSAQAAVLATSEARLGILGELSQLELELSDRESELGARSRSRRSRLLQAEAKVREAEDALLVTTLRAPSAGWVEALFVSPGSAVQPGQPLARMVPRSAPRSVAALVPAEDAAHIAPGDEASVELLPQSGSESPELAARVSHVSREVTRPDRVQLLLGALSPKSWVELELELIDAPKLGGTRTAPRSGTRALVTLRAPERRLGQVLYAAVRDRLSLSAWR